MFPRLTVLWIVHAWLLLQSRVPKVDSALDCPFLIAPLISCAQSWQCSGLSILDCSFNLVCPKLAVPWIVHSWLLLQSRVPKVDSALDCPFLIVVPSVVSNVYLSVSLDCPFLIAPSISCAQGWQCSGLSILDCSFNLVCPKLAVLWIVHSWLLLQSRVPKVDSDLDCPFLIVFPSVFSNVYLSVSLDCPFLIAPSISCAQGWQCSGLSILDCSFNLVCPKLTVLWIVHSWLSSLRFSLTFICQCLWIVHSWLSSLRFSLTFICQCLWIVHSWLLLQSCVPKVDSALDCPLLIAPSISCAQSWQCSGLSIIDCSFNLVCSKLAVLWIVHSWLLLQCRVPKVDSALDCPLLIAPSISCVQS